MAEDGANPGSPTKGHGTDDPELDPGSLNRGARPGKGSGAVTGSGAGAGGGGTPEDYDHDPQAGDGKIEQQPGSRPDSGGDAPVGGSH